MRIRRNKNHRRILRFYKLAFGLRPPYRVICDGPFLTHALQQKINVKDQLPKVLGAPFTPMVTGCIREELRRLGPLAHGAAHIAKGYQLLNCHHKNPLVAAKCIREQIGKNNERKLLVATQDPELMQSLRSVPGVPVIRLHGGVPTVEDPSNESRTAHKQTQEKLMNPMDWEKAKLPVLRQTEALKEAAAGAPKKKRRGPKGANPLSCKKPQKRTKASSTPAEDPEAPKKKRVRSRRMGTRITEVSGAQSDAADKSSKSTDAEATDSRGGRKRQRTGAKPAPAEASSDEE